MRFSVYFLSKTKAAYVCLVDSFVFWFEHFRLMQVCEACSIKVTFSNPRNIDFSK